MAVAIAKCAIATFGEELGIGQDFELDLALIGVQHTFLHTRTTRQTGVSASQTSTGSGNDEVYHGSGRAHG